MPLETITITIPNGNANPQTKTVQINVDSNTGTGNGSVTFTGINGGVDAIVATANIAGVARTSNTASVAWQACPSQISIGPVTMNEFVNPGANTSWHGLGAQQYGPLTFNSVIINQVVNNSPVFGLVTPNGDSGEYRLVPPRVAQVKPDGTSLTPNGTTLPNSQLEVTILQFKIVVNKAGIETFYFLADDAWAFYVGGGVTRTGGSANSLIFVPNGSSPASPSTYNGLPIMGTRNTAAAPIQGVDTVYVNFPAAGTYDAVIWNVNNSDNQAYTVTTFAAGQAAIANNPGFIPGQVMLPVAIQAAPPPTTPAGSLQLSIANGNLHVVGNTVTLNIGLNNIHYATEPYIPLLEGTSGKLFIYNSPSAPTFTYPTYNGQPVDKTAAVTSGAINLSGNNGSWQGRLSPVYNDAADSNFSLKYNGSGFDAHVDTTSLTITSDDVSWFNSVNKAFDLFAVTSGNGGTQFQITVDYMVRPTPFVASVSPGTVSADGQNHSFTVSLTKPISPRQQGTQFGTGNTFTAANPTFSGGVTFVSITPILDAGAWLTGWTVVATVPSSTANGSFTMSMNVTGNLTYLNGTAFTTGAITYVNGVVGTINTTGVTFVAPTEYSFAKSPNTNTIVGSITLTAQVFATDNGNITLTFLRQNVSTNTSIGAGVKTSGPTAVVGGYITSFSLTVTSQFAWGTPLKLGFTATDALSGLSVTWFNSTSYTNTNPDPNGGGGGGGCPAVEMFIDEYNQVSDVFAGMRLDTLAGETKDYLSEPVSREIRQVQWFEYSTEPCHHLIAENGAEVIISASTPVPTRESITAIAEGHPAEEVPSLASQIIAGMHVITDVGNGPEWSMLTETLAIGMRRVARLFCGGRNFAAGVKPGKYIYTHNSPVNIK